MMIIASISKFDSTCTHILAFEFVLLSFIFFCPSSIHFWNLIYIIDRFLLIFVPLLLLTYMYGLLFETQIIMHQSIFLFLRTSCMYLYKTKRKKKDYHVKGL